MKKSKSLKFTPPKLKCHRLSFQNSFILGLACAKQKTCVDLMIVSWHFSIVMV